MDKRKSGGRYTSFTLFSRRKGASSVADGAVGDGDDGGAGGGASVKDGGGGMICCVHVCARVHVKRVFPGNARVDDDDAVVGNGQPDSRFANSGTSL